MKPTMPRLSPELTSRRTSLAGALALSMSLLGSACLESAPSQDEPSYDDLKSMEAADQVMQDADQYLPFADEDVPSAIHTTLEWDKVYTYGGSWDAFKMSTDYFPGGMDWLLFPVAAIKLVYWVPDQIFDWFRGSDHEKWVITNDSSEPLRLVASVGLMNLNWRLARGKASLRVCTRLAGSGEDDCEKLGSVKKGEKVSYDLTILERKIPVKAYTREYTLEVPANATSTIDLKHKLECTSTSFGFAGQSDCVLQPSVAIEFSKAN